MSFNKKFFTTGGIVASSAAPFRATDNFTPFTYTGNRVDSTTTNPLSIGFQPDLVWIKHRNNSYSHHLMDSVRGGNNVLYSNNDYAESGINNNFGGIDFVSDGITVKSSAYAVDNLNKLNDNLVAWCWKAGGTAVSNTDGDIASSVSANVDAGFSIVKTSFGSGQALATVGHGLNEAPTLVIIKRTDATEDWYVKYNVVDGSPDQMRLNTTAASESGTFTTTSTTVSGLGVTSAAHTTIAYCFHSVDGYQKIGSYSGASGRATISGLGFKPRFVMIKNITETGTNWHLFDNQRNTITDKLNNYLYANSSAIESGASTFAIFVGDTQTSPVTDYNDGFQVAAVNDKQINLTGDTFIYLAIA